MPTISSNIARINESILEAAAISNFPEKVTLVAVSKGHSFDKIIEAFKAGIIHFGENYLQEALYKKLHLEEFAIQWHFLGPIQSNKCRLIAENFDWVHSVDRIKIMKLLNDFRPSNAPPLNICIQINSSGEDTKSGIAMNDAQSHLMDLVSALKELPKLKLRGIMSIPTNTESSEQVINEFKSMYMLYSKLKNQIDTVDTLSMGMSNDFKPAIEHGSNLVRIGTAIFGARAMKTQGDDN
ncbi:YggS family pyridoxal phosphate-dependent enzyme [Candidatus Methylopumilus universalis]|uniref:YggS family pyridoxal phosphate-dependent enzyme n=1 Tax=Candidatus Methylopumilus universalis TaxID=2588536 RepID=UPI0011211F74|nr:YggS family pyridoxal phosphate-dependent enzyme [Candidatus Methylopumilus universalis]QDC70340.1 YggS family pyridoxal phosphate-dependent enzyme [Candidatus Methylopumilus universalis]